MHYRATKPNCPAHEPRTNGALTSSIITRLLTIQLTRNFDITLAKAVLLDGKSFVQMYRYFFYYYSVLHSYYTKRMYDFSEPFTYCRVTCLSNLHFAMQSGQIFLRFDLCRFKNSSRSNICYYENNFLSPKIANTRNAIGRRNSRGKSIKHL